jgi:hypothetical protein
MGGFLFLSCGAKNTPTGDTAIKRETDVVDVGIHEGCDDCGDSQQPTAKIGWPQGNLESRLLILFPKLSQLWDEKIILSSLGVVELLLYTKELNINPDNIELWPLNQAWSPFAKWSHPLGILDKSVQWTPGGSWDLSGSAITPAIRVPSSGIQAKELAFDLTSLMKQWVAENRTQLGFMIRAVKSELNGKDELEVFSSNYPDSLYRPVSVLTFATQDGVEK